MVDITGLDKVDVLRALYDATGPLGMGILHDKPDGLTVEDAQATITEAGERGYFDYVHGRPIKCDLSGTEFDPGMFDRDAGEGAAERAIAELRERSGAAQARPATA